MTVRRTIEDYWNSVRNRDQQVPKRLWTPSETPSGRCHDWHPRASEAVSPLALVPRHATGGFPDSHRLDIGYRPTIRFPQQPRSERKSASARMAIEGTKPDAHRAKGYGLDGLLWGDIDSVMCQRPGQLAVLAIICTAQHRDVRR
jgi:hypothetical protein